MESQNLYAEVAKNEEISVFVEKMPFVELKKKLSKSGWIQHFGTNLDTKRMVF